MEALGRLGPDSQGVCVCVSVPVILTLTLAARICLWLLQQFTKPPPWLCSHWLLRRRDFLGPVGEHALPRGSQLAGPSSPGKGSASWPSPGSAWVFAHLQAEICRDGMGRALLHILFVVLNHQGSFVLLLAASGLNYLHSVLQPQVCVLSALKLECPCPRRSFYALQAALCLRGSPLQPFPPGRLL